MPQYDPLNPDKYTIHINILQSAIAPWAEIYRSAFLGLTEGTEVPAEVEAFLWKLGIMFRENNYFINGPVATTIRGVIDENRKSGLTNAEASIAVIAYVSRLCYINPDLLPEDSLKKASDITRSVLSKTKMGKDAVEDVAKLIKWDLKNPAWDTTSAIYGDMIRFRYSRMNAQATELCYRREYHGVPDIKWYNYILGEYNDLFERGIFFTPAMIKAKEKVAKAVLLNLMESADKRLVTLEAELKVLSL